MKQKKSLIIYFSKLSIGGMERALMILLERVIYVKTMILRCI